MLYNYVLKKGGAMLNEKFEERMKALLKDEYEQFINELIYGKEQKGVRINRLKCDPERTLNEISLELKAISYAKDGYLLSGEYSGIGNTPEHISGQIYMQDPGAMASVSALSIRPGMKVADLCAAPGGKSSQIAAMLENEGFLLSNEYVPKRAKILVGNYERLGIKCGVVTSLDTKEIANLYENYFDVAIVDAPCSGEGMFRKNNPAIEEWSEDNVRESSVRQREILKNGAKIVKDGGSLLYSTCTYSLEENEMVIDDFLASHPEFMLCDVKDELVKATSDGIVFDGAKCKELYKARRFYPHKSPGEGQFLALFTKKTCNGARESIKDTLKSPGKDELSIINNFFKESLISAPKARIAKYGDNTVLISHGSPLPQKGVFSAGVNVGEIRGKLLFPAHQFFMAYSELFKNRIELSRDEAIRYCRGEELIIENKEIRGWCVLLYNSSALGGGKISDGKIKNHFPKGLRIN